MVIYSTMFTYMKIKYSAHVIMYKCIMNITAAALGFNPTIFLAFRV